VFEDPKGGSMQRLTAKRGLLNGRSPGEVGRLRRLAH